MVRITTWYTSVQSYKKLLEDFPLLSLSLLSKFIKRKIDAIKYAQALKKDDIVVSDLRSGTKGSRYESGCYVKN